MAKQGFAYSQPLPGFPVRLGRMQWFGWTTTLCYSYAPLDCGATSRRLLIFGRALFAAAPRPGT